MSTLGIFNSSNVAPNQVKPSFAKMIYEQMPGGQATLFGITSRLKTETLGHWKHSWSFKDYMQPMVRLLQALPASAPGATSVVAVEEAGNIIEGMVLLFTDSMEQTMVVGVTGNQIALRRGAGITAPRALPTGSEAYSVGTAFEESSLRPLPLTRSLREVDNITQIFRNTWAVSGTVKSMMMQVGDGQSAESKADATMFHARDIEQAIVFGERYQGVWKGQPHRKMDGLISTIKQHAPQNYVQAPNVLTYDALEEMLDPLFDVVTDNKNKNDRLLLVDSHARKAISKLGRLSGNIELMPGQSKFGHSFDGFKTSRGEFTMLEHPLFNTLPFAKGMMLAVDLSSMGLCYMQGRNTDYKDFNPNANSSSGVAQDNGIDAQGGAFLTEVTMMVEAPNANGVIFGIKEVGCVPCVAAPTIYRGSIGTNKPCQQGEVDPNTQVTVTITGAAPTTAVPVATPTGVINITTDAAGNGSALYTVGTMPTYQFVVLQSAANLNTVWQPASISVCVKQPCDGAELVNDDNCAVVTAPIVVPPLT